MKIGAVATRIPVSEEETCCSPAAISNSGPAIWTTASSRIGATFERSPPSAPRCAASGSSTSAASAVRTLTITAGLTSSSSASLMKRYEEPQSPESVSSRIQERRDTRTRIADALR